MLRALTIRAYRCGLPGAHLLRPTEFHTYICAQPHKASHVQCVLNAPRRLHVQPTEAHSHIRPLRHTPDAQNHMHMLRLIEALAYFTHSAHVRSGLSMYTRVLRAIEAQMHTCTRA